jgi:hypothetical protein
MELRGEHGGPHHDLLSALQKAVLLFLYALTIFVRKPIIRLVKSECVSKD